jgi:hypothetical protein
VQNCPFCIAVELCDDWNKNGTTRSILYAIAVGLGVIEPLAAAGSTPPEDVAIAISNPKTFGGSVFGIDQLPEWMKSSLAMTTIN